MATQIAHKLTVEEYECLAEIGEDDRTELINGEVIWMSPIGDRHVACVNELNRILGEQVGRTAIVSIQNPIRVSSTARPQPDASLLRRRTDKYAHGLATPAEVLLVVEVADSSLQYDRNTKGPLYAGAGIPEYWLINLGDEQIEIYTEPINGRYQAVRTVPKHETFTSAALSGLVLSAADILL